MTKRTTPKKDEKKDPKDCDHPRCKPPNGYDHERAKTMSAEEIRKAFPRFWGRCPDCDTQTVHYASYEHYVAGDW